MSLPKTTKPPPRIQILEVRPQVDCGRHPVKRVAGERVEVTARIFRDGHDALGAAVRYRRAGTTRWQEAPLEPRGNDHWSGSFLVDTPGTWSFRVEAWTDRIASYQDEIRRKVEGGQQDLASELAEGAALVGRPSLTAQEALAAPAGDRSGTASSEVYEVDVDRELARFGSWYELFPRSWGGFEGVRALLPDFAELGFDVLYLPPIHPIGHTNRKGRNNALVAGPGDPGSPWAIGSEQGGHDAIDPALGTLAEFERLVADAKEHGIEIAIDFAIQCSPDHPWLKEHPEWFNRRPDGTLKYAENPPKRYQDIYNVNFESEDWKGLWAALRDIVLTWVERGVTVFRVDNPHTKPVPFWEWMIREVRRQHPDVIFLAEAFTRPAMMTTLAKAGFAQSYTYFTWKNTRWELLEFMGQLLEWKEIYRPNVFANTPDILHEYLQHGGRAAFEARLVLAATLSPTYGIYSGFENAENVPVREGSEEYLDSEKYEVKRRSLDGPLLPLVATLNRARRENPALQRLDDVAFLETENDQLFAYRKQIGDNDVICVVNLDPSATQRGVCVLPASTGLPPAYRVRDLILDEEWTWHVGRNFVELAPGKSHLLKVVR
ncbi:MAG: alpha-1,4-glucan--maltose-1-phosphate maltosyltransferase [Acidobacteriota bacterium]|nr:alpha-1,4-glucan--maltose-1-phosphate maltosyltransferase [Acidobacteriota bacterium]